MIQISDDKPLLCNLLLLMSVVACEKEILSFTSHEGGKVVIRCPYESKYRESDKYLCRGECAIVYKDKIVESGPASKKDERFSLSDDETAQIFTVTITDLRREDEGKYWCGVKTGFMSSDVYTEIDLKIKHVSRVSGVTGKHLNITCPYERDSKEVVKFICKGSDPSSCATSAIKVSSDKANNGRFSLREDEPAGGFTVTISDLTVEDSGKYWCGAAEKTPPNKNEWISVVDLHISGERTPFTTASFHTSTPATAEASSSRPVTSSLSSSPSPSPSTTAPFLLFLSSPADAASPKPQSGFTKLIMVTVIAILTGLGFSLFVYLRWKQKKAGVQNKDAVHGPTENLPNRDTETTEDAHTACDYEEIIDYSVFLPVFDEHDASVYALAQLPSSPSGNVMYSSVQFSSPHHSDRTSDGLEACD